MRYLVCALALWLVGSVCTWADVLPGLRMDKESGISMKVLNLYEDIPPSGFLPLRVEIRNDSSSSHRWLVQTAQTGAGFGLSTRSLNSLEVPAKSERTFDLLVPLAMQSREAARYSTLMVTVTGHGVSKGLCSAYSSGSGRPPSAYLGMGKELSVKNWGALAQRLEKDTRSLDGTSLDTSLLPEDWRALSGFEVIVFTAEEWRKIAPPSRNAILEWVAQGGRLILGFSGSPEGLPAAGPLGTGDVEQWNLAEEWIERMVQTISSTAISQAYLASRDYNWNWSLAAQVGRPEPPLLMLIVFVVVFALVVGPVNFIWLAPSGSRHRLFWTTPAISLAASLLLAGLILTREGFGGRGLYYVAMLSMPSEHKTVRWQEQVSRTGVLSESSFIPSEPSLILPISLKKGTPAPFPRNSDTSYALDGNVWSGDWFRSRSTQAQIVTAIVPSRERVEVRLVDGKPQALSTFPQTLDEIFYFDEKGGIWRGKTIAPGRPVTLTPTTPEIQKAWQERTLLLSGNIARGRVEAFTRGPLMGKFLASSHAIPPVKTLASIRWTETGGILFGEVAKP